MVSYESEEVKILSAEQVGNYSSKCLSWWDIILLIAWRGGTQGDQQPSSTECTCITHRPAPVEQHPQTSTHRPASS